MEEMEEKWRGLFVHPLFRVLRNLSDCLQADIEAMEYVESQLIKLLTILIAKPSPVTVAEVEERVMRTMPSLVEKRTLSQAQTALERGKKKANLVLPLDKTHNMLKEVLQNNRLDDQVSLFLVAILEYISSDILKLAVDYVKNINHTSITCQDVKVAMWADKLLMDMFHQDDVMTTVYVDHEDPLTPKPAQTYDEIVKELIVDEKQYLRDLHMITKVFRDVIMKQDVISSTELDAIFSNINEVTEFTMTLIGSLEDTLEMTEEDGVPSIGSCFEEIAEAEDFDVYDKYSRDVLSEEFQRTMDSLSSRPSVIDSLQSAGHGLDKAVKYYLPVLLLGPIHHCFHYFKYIELLMNLTPSMEDGDTLKQVNSMLTPLQIKLQNDVRKKRRKLPPLDQRLGPNRLSRQQSLQRLSHIQSQITNWEGKDITTNSSELIMEGKLKVLADNKKKFSERYVFLCDGIIIICKQHVKRMPNNNMAEYRLRDTFLIRSVEVNGGDHHQADNHLFELQDQHHQQPLVIFKADSPEEKNGWMAALVMLKTKSMLERQLDAILAEEKERHPLRFPPTNIYRFAEPDSKDNIVFSANESGAGGVPLIKGATLVKLVERLTYHVYADPMFMKTFLTTYRSFSTPNELLDLLIERFNIPDPEFNHDNDVVADSRRIAQDMKRFRKEYSQPVQFRVLNVLKHWVDQHFYDFEQDHQLLSKVVEFLDKISGKSMRKWVECIQKNVQRRKSSEDKKEKKFDFDLSPPPIEEHIENPEEGWPELLTYHPIEIARQLTLLEFQYYRAVKPSELVDQAWTREDKDKRSPNLLRMIRHTTNFTRYLQKLMVETENLEERVSVFQRTLEIMMVLQEYNNFNGVLAITSAMNSSAVFRLSVTKERLPTSLLKGLEEASSYVQAHCKVYWERLRSINPPCVPFFGQYQTNIMFLEEGNPDLLQDTNLINFSKRRKVAEIISEIQQYQNQPYCLSTHPKLRSFLEKLDPFPDMSEKEVTDYLWSKSMEIEPRQAEKRKTEVERRWKGLNLKSPGIKPPKVNLHPTRAPAAVAAQPAVQDTLSQMPLMTSPPDPDPRKIAVMIPAPPPPLPPKRRSVPPIVLRHPDTPPPLPPRSKPLESRSPLMDPVVPRRNSAFQDNSRSPPPAIIPRRYSSMPNGPKPPPLCLRASTLETTMATLTPNPSPVSRPSPASSHSSLSTPASNHFTFSSHETSSPPPPPRPPPHARPSASAVRPTMFTWDLPSSQNGVLEDHNPRRSSNDLVMERKSLQRE